MATHSSILAWEVSWTEEPDGLPSMRLQKVRHNLATEQQQGKDSKGLCPSILGNIFMLAFITSQSFFPHSCHFTRPSPHEVQDLIIIPILQTRELRPKEIK